MGSIVGTVAFLACSFWGDDFISVEFPWIHLLKDLCRFVGAFVAHRDDATSNFSQLSCHVFYNCLMTTTVVLAVFSISVHADVITGLHLAG
jgi:hypothetical protein